ncbi:ATP-dependent Clp protease proteolytic subunit, partial [Streptomyces olivaceoviridis]
MSRPSARHVLPEFTERTGSAVRTLDPYAKLFEDRIVFLGTPVDTAAANDVTAQLMYLEHAAPDRDITLYVNSPGGSFDGPAVRWRSTFPSRTRPASPSPKRRACAPRSRP